ncbi:hypothetical protein K469DRAFT_721915 [Zopfia rhizophila CBS 207.26]|uniref:Ankyrin n=1 Tax=Zopfia rhizophila CBS 207.26 TaxID=1314779 RepID=A0A6A6DBK6_9PEZI|nr:hypothetical protein K469DRAFT_721915 [Zopfia rhizophila CBS 207.26]
MQKHIAYHLERIALFALPTIEDIEDDQDDADRSSDSNQVIQHRGRQSSVLKDFAWENDSSLLSIFRHPPTVADRSSTPLTLEAIRVGASPDGPLRPESNQNRCDVHSWLSTAHGEIDTKPDIPTEYSEFSNRPPEEMSPDGHHITEVVKVAAEDEISRKGVMMLLLDGRGADVPVTEEAAAQITMSFNKEAITLLLNRRGDDVPIIEEVVARIAGSFDKEVMTLLLDRRGDDVRITEEVVKVAAGNVWSGKEVIKLLLDRREDDVQITEEVVKAAAGNVWSGKEVMTLLLDRRGDDVQITEEVVKAAAGNVWSGKDVMTLLLDRSGDDIPITEEVVAQIARLFDKEVMTLLLDRRGDDVQITEEVVKAAAGNVWRGKEVITLLLDRRGDDVPITEEVVAQIARSFNKEVMTLLLDRRGNDDRISNSIRSQSSHNGLQSERRTTTAPLSLSRPLPSCARSESSAEYDDWYTLENCSNFDICPSCYEGVFADTPFDVYFMQGRRIERPLERFCDFSSPWMRLAWLLTIKQQRSSPDLIYTLATISDIKQPCPKEREISVDRAVWYGIPDQRNGIHVANFAVCSCDVKFIEALFPSVRGYFTRLPSTTPLSGLTEKHLCSLRVTSRRFPKYLDLLVELDQESQCIGHRPDINRFVQLARDYAFKGECQRDKALMRKPWHFIPSLPEFTVCEECYDEFIWPAINAKNPSSIANPFNRTIQPVPGEDDLGTSCCLYSPRMRRVWERAVQDNDFGYLRRKAIERKRMELRLGRERKEIVRWMAETERGRSGFERVKRDLRDVEREWMEWE